MISFKFCALSYLNNWQKYDRDFCERLKSSDFRKRQEVVIDVAKNYKISRNFKKESPDSGSRLVSVVKALDSISPSLVNNDNYVSQVEMLTSEIARVYGQRNLSAASKLLWIKCRSPIIIFDSRALRALKKEFKKKSKPGCYASYCAAWLSAYAEKRNEIVAAASKLESVIEFSFESNGNVSVIRSLAQEEWFLHRIFNHYLWHLGGS